MDQQRIAAARRFVYAEARLLERRLYEVLFESSEPAAVIDALRGYRNPDGGFGHGLEPDKRVPDSQGLDVEVAFATMDAARLVDDDMVSRACDFLATLGAGVSCVRPPIRAFPHAPHWSEAFSEPHLNPTAGLAGYLWKWGVTHPWRELATKLCWAELDAVEAAQQADGGWPITWPTIGAAVEAEWRGCETVRALQVLRAYGRFP